MAFVIMQAVMKRLEERGKTKLLGELGTSMKLPRSAGHSSRWTSSTWPTSSGPPMNRIPEYRRKRGLPEATQSG